jgi:hypothetical protein
MVGEQKTFPIAVSADPRRNAYYTRCHVHGQMRAYASCLARIEGRLTDSEECNAAIAKTDCPAMLLKDQEERAGRALFFVERTVVQTFINKVKDWVAPVVKGVVGEREEIKSKFDISRVETNIYASLVNKPVKKLELLPGESPLDALRRMKNQPK